MEPGKNGWVSGTLSPAYKEFGNPEFIQWAARCNANSPLAF